MGQTTLDVRTDWDKKIEGDLPVGGVAGAKHIIKTTGTFNFPLTEQEKADAMDEVIGLTKRLNLAQDSFDTVKKKYKAQIEDLDAEIASLISKAEDGTEKTVDCLQITDFGTGTVSFTDLNGVLLHERPLTDADRQLELAPKVEGSAKEAMVEYSEKDESKAIRETARKNTSTLDTVTF